MYKFIIFSLLFVAHSLSAQQDGPRKAVDTFFEAFHARDTVKMKSIFADGMVLHSVSEGASGSKLTGETVQGLLNSIASIPPGVEIEEKLLSYEIKVDNTMANVWTQYEFYINGKFSHSGVNSFQLFRNGDVWKIVHIIDTRRKK